MSPFPAEPLNTASSGSMSGKWSAPVQPAPEPDTGGEVVVETHCGCKTEGPHCHCLSQMPHKIAQVGNGIACESALSPDDLGLWKSVKPYCFDTKEKRDWPQIAERQAHKVSQAVLASEWLADRLAEARAEALREAREGLLNLAAGFDGECKRGIDIAAIFLRVLYDPANHEAARTAPLQDAEEVGE